MKTQKLNLFAFKQDELSRENISLIKAGAPIDGKPPGPSSGGGSGGGGHCYYDFETRSYICEPIDTGEEIVEL
jgi:hypothetical protein